MSYFVFHCIAVANQLPRLREREKELSCLLSFNCNYVVSVRRGHPF